MRDVRVCPTQPNPLAPTCTYLSQGAELHDDPHGVFCDHSDQLDNVRVVELTHRHCRGTTHVFMQNANTASIHVQADVPKLTGFLEELFSDAVRRAVLAGLDGDR